MGSDKAIWSIDTQNHIFQLVLDQCLEINLDLKSTCSCQPSMLESQSYMNMLASLYFNLGLDSDL